MKVSVLASGSKGNCTYIETEKSKILIDLGTSSLYVERALKDLNVNPRDIDAILLTHTHVDHTSGLRVFIKKYHTPIYLTQVMLKELNKSMVIQSYEILENQSEIKDFSVLPIKTSHDTEDSQGYVITHASHTLVYITDTGYINMKHLKLLQDKEMYIIESNHDVEMLMNGKYPYPVKQRILGDRGHLSNQQCATYLGKMIGNHTKSVILIHLSQDNNTEELARKTVEEMLHDKEKEIQKFVISSQKERTEFIEV